MGLLHRRFVVVDGLFAAQEAIDFSGVVPNRLADPDERRPFVPGSPAGQRFAAHIEQIGDLLAGECLRYRSC